MKTSFLSALGLLVLALASCSTYQVNVLSSTNTTKDDKTGVFNFENDSVKITYSFSGNNAPVSIQVFNKMDKPLYVDWQRSAAIIGNDAVSYMPNQVNISGRYDGQTYSWQSRPRSAVSNYSSTSGTISAVADLPKNTTFLPPHSQAGNVPILLTKDRFQLPDSGYRKEKINLFDGNSSMRAEIQVADFMKDNSPLKFKSYLTLYTQDGSVVKPMAYQHEFYVSKIVNINTEPYYLPEFQRQRGDFFLNAKLPQTSTAATTAN
ncbi:hypothetical protein [Mucilaginibacter sp. CSA2-8R]|uniref:hypothetical protein n=1 Tax=Mucilaginibacter sp. CSA2-8R TaxID=3141542 RepID=UPI00315DE168